MSIFGDIIRGISGGKQAANAAKIICELTGEWPDEYKIARLKESRIKGNWGNEHELALIFLRSYCKDFYSLSGTLERSVSLPVQKRIFEYFDRCKAQGLLSNYTIDEYENLKKEAVNR